MKPKLGSLVRIDESGEIESHLFGEVSFVQRHQHLEPRGELSDVRQASTVVERSHAPDGRILFAALSIVAVAGRATRRIEYRAALDIGSGGIDLQLWTACGPAGRTAFIRIGWSMDSQVM